MCIDKSIEKRYCTECGCREIEYRQRICSECREVNHSIAVDTWQSENKEKIGKYQAEYKKKNKDKLNKYMKEYMKEYRRSKHA